MRDAPHGGILAKQATERKDRMSPAELKKLYRQRRRYASAAMGSGLKAMQAWGALESIERTLANVDPDGDWRYESYNFTTGGWDINR